MMQQVLMKSPISERNIQTEHTQESKWWKIFTTRAEKDCSQGYFKILSQIKRNLINHVFFKFIIYVYLPQAPKILATPLHSMLLKLTGHKQKTHTQSGPKVS
jgi:hypothetical protein